MSKFIKYFFQSIIIYIFFIIGRLLGLSLSRKFFSFFFTKFGSIFKSKLIVNKNIKIFTKYAPSSNSDKIISNMWKNYGMTFIEYAFLNHFRKNDSHIKIIGIENIKSLINSNKQAIFVSGHFANFELMSMEITKKNINLATIYRPLNNYFLNPFMEYLRKKYICKNQIKKGINGVRDAIFFLKKKFSIALMIDQRVSEGELINFFGKPALTTTLPAQLAIKFNLPIIPVYIERKIDNSFLIEFHKEIDVAKFRNKIELSKVLNKSLEQMIIKNPEQWIWTHNRWK